MDKDWLFKKDNYIPKEDKDIFINKSIISILNVLSRIKPYDIKNYNFLYELNPALKFVFTVLNLILISLSHKYTYILIIDIIFLALVMFLNKKESKNIILLSLIIPMFTFIMLIPSMFLGNFKNSFLIIFKIFGTMMCVNLLSYTTKWHHITKALKLFFIPDIFILVMDITIKYILLLGEFSLEMLYSLKLRSIGKNNKKFNSISKILGNLFLKSKDMGEEMFFAMECRGFTGEYNSNIKLKFKTKDIIYFLLNIFIIFLWIKL